MTSRIIVAIVAAVLSLAAPVAAQPVSVPCSDAEDTVYRFYTQVPTRATQRTSEYDFEIWNTNTFGTKSTIIRLDVQQYNQRSGWNTRLSIPRVSRVSEYFKGNVRLHWRQWTDVRVGCEGEGGVIMKVNNRVVLRNGGRDGSAHTALVCCPGNTHCNP